jgi:hypothetical protein
MEWQILHSREQSTVADTWTEYLCAKIDETQITLGICIYELLGDLPREWFDDDGELLPEFQDENGDLELPDEYDGKPVTGNNGEWLLGPLDRWNNDEIATITELSLESITEALHALQWDPADASEVLTALAKLRQLG